MDDDDREFFAKWEYPKNWQCELNAEKIECNNQGIDGKISIWKENNQWNSSYEIGKISGVHMEPPMEHRKNIAAVAICRMWYLANSYKLHRTGLNPASKKYYAKAARENSIEHRECVEEALRDDPLEMQQALNFEMSPEISDADLQNLGFAKNRRNFRK